MLAKLEQAQLAASAEPSNWPKQAEYDSAKERLDVLRTQWTLGNVSNDLFFSTVAELEKQIARLWTEAQSFTASLQRQRSRSNTMPARSGGAGS